MLTPQQIEDTAALVNNLSLSEQVWMSGYLHGLSVQANDTSATPLSMVPNTTTTATLEAPEVTLLYGSQTGNSRKIAEDTAKKLEAQGNKVTLQNLLHYRTKQLKKEKNLFVVISTHGNGEPPDEALGFFKFINADKAPDLTGINYSILALGDSSYDEYCQTGYDLDTRLEALGANRVLDVVPCDVDYADDAGSWQSDVLENVKPAEVNKALSQGAVLTNENASDQVFDQNNPYAAEVLEVLELTDEGSDKSVFHLELSLEDTGISYLPGDIVAIKSNNDEALVDAIIQEVGASGDHIVTIKKQALTLKDALTGKCELSTINRRQLTAYATLTENADLLSQTKDKSALQTELEAADVLDVLQLWPSDLTPQDLIDWLRPLAARQYSIASSAEAHSEEVHVLAKLISYEYRGRTHGGTCTTNIANVVTGDTVDVYFKENSSFKLPENSDTKVIMIGAGTGVAPFRSFLFERESQGILGNSWLFFGEQRFQSDFLYQTEWQQFLASGVLEKMDVAFSRDQAEKIYVQHKLLAQAESLYQWLESGAHIYVCGDMNHMAKDVHQALIDVIANQSERTEDEASAWLDQLIAEKRYQRDIY